MSGVWTCDECGKTTKDRPMVADDFEFCLLRGFRTINLVEVPMYYESRPRRKRDWEHIPFDYKAWCAQAVDLCSWECEERARARSLAVKAGVIA